MRRIFSTLLIFLLIACGSEEVSYEIPAYVIPEEKMIDIIIDMHIADATMMNLQLDKEHKRYQAEIYYEQIFKKYDINKSDFDTSIMFYARIPAYYEGIYDEVLEKMNKMRDQIKEVNNDTIK